MKIMILFATTLFELAFFIMTLFFLHSKSSESKEIANKQEQEGNLIPLCHRYHSYIYIYI